MSNRYHKTERPWFTENDVYAPFVTQVSDCLDKRTGTVYADGAYRVIDTRTGKPAKRGKGGTLPFYGETAWSDAERLAGDLHTAERYAR